MPIQQNDSHANTLNTVINNNTLKPVVNFAYKLSQLIHFLWAIYFANHMLSKSYRHVVAWHLITITLCLLHDFSLPLTDYIILFRDKSKYIFL